MGKKELLSLLRGSFEAKRNKFLFFIFAALTGVAMMIFIVLELPILSFLYLLLSAPCLICCAYGAFVFDTTPENYLIRDVQLNEYHEKYLATQFFTIRFPAEDGSITVADTTNIFSTNGVSAPQLEECLGKIATIAYHKETKKVYILRIL